MYLLQSLCYQELRFKTCELQSITFQLPSLNRQTVRYADCLRREMQGPCLLQLLSTGGRQPCCPTSPSIMQ